MMNQVGVKRQWGFIQYSESQQEQGNELRATFNFYKKELEFGDSYLLTEAEVAYQVKQSPNDVDISKVVKLMNQANVACSKLFDQIEPKDIQDALDVLLQE
jgi:hypothetical protein